MLHGNSALKATILVGEHELGEVVKSDDSTSLNIILGVSLVPWGAFKDQGRLRFRIETSSTPKSSPCNTPPAPVSVDGWQKKSCVSSSMGFSALHMSSSSPSSLGSFPADVNSASPNSVRQAVYVSSAPASSSSGMCLEKGHLEGVALYSGVAGGQFWSPAPQKTPWGVTVDVREASPTSSNSRRQISHKYELLAKSAGRGSGPKGIFVLMVQCLQ